MHDHGQPARLVAAWHHAPPRRTLVVAMSDVTLILQQIEDGDPSAAGQLLPLVNDELHKLPAVRMASESPERGSRRCCHLG